MTQVTLHHNIHTTAYQVFVCRSNLKAHLFSCYIVLAIEITKLTSAIGTHVQTKPLVFEGWSRI